MCLTELEQNTNKVGSIKKSIEKYERIINDSTKLLEALKKEYHDLNQWTLEDKKVKFGYDMAIEKMGYHDGCVGCRYEYDLDVDEPCDSCKHNYGDRWTV